MVPFPQFGAEKLMRKPKILHFLKPFLQNAWILTDFIMRDPNELITTFGRARMAHSRVILNTIPIGPNRIRP